MGARISITKRRLEHLIFFFFLILLPDRPRARMRTPGARDPASSPSRLKNI